MLDPIRDLGAYSESSHDQSPGPWYWPKRATCGRGPIALIRVLVAWWAGQGA